MTAFLLSSSILDITDFSIFAYMISFTTFYFNLYLIVGTLEYLFIGDCLWHFSMQNISTELAHFFIGLSHFSILLSRDTFSLEGVNVCQSICTISNFLSLLLTFDINICVYGFFSFLPMIILIFMYSGLHIFIVIAFECYVILWKVFSSRG